MKTLSIIILFAIILVATPASAQRWSKAEMDSAHAMLDSLNDDASMSTMTIGQFRQAMTYLYNRVLNDGHKEYASMPRVFPNGVVGKANKATDSVNTRVTLTQAGVTTLDTRTTEVAQTANGTATRVGNVEELISVKDALNDRHYTDAQKAILQQIRNDVAKHANSTADGNTGTTTGNTKKYY